jgi:hypothetical protein
LGDAREGRLRASVAKLQDAVVFTFQSIPRV